MAARRGTNDTPRIGVSLSASQGWTEATPSDLSTSEDPLSLDEGCISAPRVRVSLQRPIPHTQPSHGT